VGNAALGQQGLTLVADLDVPHRIAGAAEIGGKTQAHLAARAHHAIVVMSFFLPYCELPSSSGDPAAQRAHAGLGPFGLLADRLRSVASCSGHSSMIALQSRPNARAAKQHGMFSIPAPAGRPSMRKPNIEG